MNKKIEIIERKIERLQRALVTTIGWISASSTGVLSQTDAKRLVDILAGNEECESNPSPHQP